jgi:hypothetical protein
MDEWQRFLGIASEMNGEPADLQIAKQGMQ